MAEKIGLPPEFLEGYRSKVVPLENFWDNKQWGASGPKMGLGVSAVLQESYQKERKFVLREDHRDHFQTYTGAGHSLAAAAMYGKFLDEGSSAYLSQDYRYVFDPTEVEEFSTAWRNRTFEQFASEIALTAFNLEPSQYGVRDPTFFLFDPKSNYDLIDFWNLRAQALGRVHPIPIDFWLEAKEELAKLAERYHRPVSGNRFGRNATLELARSISSEEMVQNLQADISDWKPGIISIKSRRDRVWQGHSNNRSSVGVEVSRPYAVEQSKIIEQDDDEYFRFDTLDPGFGDDAGHSHNDYSWVNVLTVSDNYHRYGLATTLPFNVDRRLRWRLSVDCKTIVNSEGWCFPQRFSGSGETIKKNPPIHYFSKYFEAAGFSTGQSEAGRIAQQMFSSLSREASALYAVGIFGSAERLRFFNKYAMGQRIRASGDEVKEESFPTRSISLTDLDKHVKVVGQEGVTRKSLVSRLIGYNVLQLGVEVKCPHCFSVNWYDLEAIKYALKCELCRQDFEFPQDDIDGRSGNWKYRLVGPFATPDYARGSYASLLTARILSEVGGRDDQLTFCTGLELTSAEERYEADLVCWLREVGRFDVLADPKLVFAECKSFATEALKSIDFARMAALGKQFPEAALVFSVLKEEFSDNEKSLAATFLRQHAGKLQYGSYERPVIFLTGRDLYFKYGISGGDDARYTYYETDALDEFASATQRLNLGMESQTQ
ncbi:hypothetical protein [Jannaschia sp. LMIT008]|uniref:hypothetical protein n=1 Tax=Jannaschia maritima TaxID=3032585 RepID=UPI002811A754|nr:hypothetical protein [Jannaschia sp. LMIT008]